MYEYRSVTAAQAQIQRLRMQGARPADSISAYLRGLRRLLSTREVAAILGRHQETILFWIGTKNLPATKQGRTWRIDPVRLAAWIEAQ